MSWVSVLSIELYYPLLISVFRSTNGNSSITGERACWASAATVYVSWKLTTHSTPSDSSYLYFYCSCFSYCALLSLFISLRIQRPCASFSYCSSYSLSYTIVYIRAFLQTLLLILLLVLHAILSTTLQHHPHTIAHTFLIHPLLQLLLLLLSLLLLCLTILLLLPYHSFSYPSTPGQHCLHFLDPCSQGLHV